MDQGTYLSMNEVYLNTRPGFVRHGPNNLWWIRNTPSRKTERGNPHDLREVVCAHALTESLHTSWKASADDYHARLTRDNLEVKSNHRLV